MHLRKREPSAPGSYRRGSAWQQNFAVLTALLLLPIFAFAADPPGGSLSSGDSSIAWTGTAAAFGAVDESTCVDGVNCDTFTLTVGGTAADWQNKVIRVDIAWAVPANDYDLYIHKDSNEGPLVGDSGAGPPSTKESAAIDPAATGTGTYTVHVVYFAGAPGADQYRGSATVISRPATRSALYLKGGMSFYPSYAVRAPVAAADGEPSSRVDKFGNYYVAGIRGVPAGVDLWYFDLRPDSTSYDPQMRNPIYRGQPDSFTQDEAVAVGADGGGDVDLAVGFNDDDPSAPPILAFASLVAANISTARSTDRGATWTLNPLGNVTGGIPADDRQWLEFHGKNNVYLLYRTLAPAVTQIQRSTDGGLTWGPMRTAGTIGQVGSIDVDQNDGTVYITGSTGAVAVGIPDPVLGEPLIYSTYQAVTDPAGGANIFIVLKVADDGTVYVCYSNGKHIFLIHSTDKGQTWSQPVRVSDGPEASTNLMPWMETGSKPGSVGLVWYGTSSASNNNDANWKVFYAYTSNATSTMPTFRQAAVTSHYIHGSNISLGGLDPTGEGANRNLIDYFQICFDPTGAAVIAYTSDHNDFDGFTYVARQKYGPSAKGGKLTLMPEGPDLPPANTFNGADPQVVDFMQDVAIGLVGVVPTNDPLDILSIHYRNDVVGGQKALSVTMKVSDLSTIPNNAVWRMNFTANAPLAAALSPTKDYSFGLSDRGDQFWLRVKTDEAGKFTYTYGTTVRNPDGSLTYTLRGNADAGSVDPVNGLVNVKIKISKLNQWVTKGPPIESGSMICGLRGQAFTGTSSGIKLDSTRGGTLFKVK